MRSNANFDAKNEQCAYCNARIWINGYGEEYMRSLTRVALFVKE